jgi:hypothetical protein
MVRKIQLGPECRRSCPGVPGVAKVTHVLIANAYSSSNSGDGLLVDETVQLVREAFGPSTELTLLASYPESFQHLGIEVIRTKPTIRGYESEYRHLLRSNFSDFDLIVGVGGGYLRAGSCVELLKTALVTGPQLFQAAKSPTPAVYMPQSIGPARLGSKPFLAHYLKRLNKVWVRDDRSLTEFASSGAERSPDLAILGMQRRFLEFDQVSPPVLTVRRHRAASPTRFIPTCKAWTHRQLCTKRCRWKRRH